MAKRRKSNLWCRWCALLVLTLLLASLLLVPLYPDEKYDGGDGGFCVKEALSCLLGLKWLQRNAHDDAEGSHGCLLAQTVGCHKHDRQQEQPSLKQQIDHVRGATTTTTTTSAFASYFDYRHRYTDKYPTTSPIHVSYDERAILLNGTRSLFLSGSIHPLRLLTRSDWNAALDHAVDAGLNMITTYVFWSVHERFANQSTLDWRLQLNDNGHCHGDADVHISGDCINHDDWTLAEAIKEIANRGLFVHLRIGPYVDSEYSYGGIPEWLPLVHPTMRMRRYNEAWMRTMENFVKKTISYMEENNLWAHQGGPIILAQIENELGQGDEGLNGTRKKHIDTMAETRRRQAKQNDEHRDNLLQKYADWCGDMVQRYAPHVLWTMCSGVTAQRDWVIDTCNGYGENSCSTDFLHGHGRILVDQPALWTEHEGGFQTWGEDPYHPTDYFWGRTAREFAFDALRWFARGGSHMNYYMFSGGYNRGRMAAGGIANMYASNVMLCPSGEPHEPMYSHLKSMHRVLRATAPILMASPPASPQTVQVQQADGSWKSGGKDQTSFVYPSRSRTDHTVIFVENNANYTVKVRVNATPNPGQKQRRILETVQLIVGPKSVIVLANQEIIFDSGLIESEMTQYRRITTPLSPHEQLQFRGTVPLESTIHPSTAVIRGPVPLEQTKLMLLAKVSSDFAWYQTSLRLDSIPLDNTLVIETVTSSSFTLYVNGIYFGSMLNHDHKEENITLKFSDLNLVAGENNITLLSESLGYYNELGRWGSTAEAKSKGITGNIYLLGSKNEIVSLIGKGQDWVMKAGLSLPAMGALVEPTPSARIEENRAPPSSASYFEFNTPPTNRPLFLDISSGRGKAWLNGIDLGRFWNITRGIDNSVKLTQRYYYIPKAILHQNGTKNVVILYHAEMCDLTKVRLVQSFVVPDPNGHFEDSIDAQGACLQ